MPKTRLQKEETVQIIQEKLGRAKSVVFTDYKGLSMKQLSDLRNKLREVNAEFTITKNTLLKHANPDLDLEGPTATLLAYDDEISPIKILVKALKDATIGKVKSGFLGRDDLPAGRQALDEAKIIQLSSLPTKDELRGQTVGVLVAPLRGIISVLQGNLRNLVYALSEIQKVKGGV
ncbi:50S ribosomal protein L10 [Candidatus Daviesbacteria bacterium RIFCSPLOWO2_02_FULL_36_8]|uniref:Large ribosomal subunit protein uL10 n=1 Tax=Candidatus Daviesbacteria bacterium RIFCSPLOWO2_02_FULL_36_8 TaxID=1797793 RepID=A0A1F5MFP8_9BACT|nr:MAG: 50S ribosomal protein L10 [Candidatus Daviesbacteria bacterium RIFCSPLOWO2_02_FULL_36_8]